MPDADVVIVGAGAGGLAAAWRLTAQGVRVTLIEAGREYLPYTDYPQSQDDFELHDFPYDAERDATGKPRHTSGKAQVVGSEWDAYRSHNRVFGRYVVGDQRRFVRYQHVRGVGGSTLHFQAEMHRYHPHALEMRSRFGVGDDWPLPYTELERYYDIIEQQVGDKGSADVVWLPPARLTGRLDLVTEAQALQVETDGSGRATSVVYRTADGSQARARGRAILLAGGAVETPRLLLLSTSARFPHGLANGNGQVGRQLTEHLAWSAVAMLPERVDAHRGQPIDGTAWRFAVPVASPRGYVGGFRLSTAHGALDLRGPAAYAERLVDGFGRAHQERMAAQFGHAVGLLAMGEWLPNDDTYVDLDPSQRDAAGLPVARLHSHLGENERQLLRHMADTTRELLAAGAGAEIVEESSALDLFSPAHVLGTCRMGSDLRQSVADADGISHEVPNLAFADGALVPSSGSGDSPSLTIMALAVRTADRLIARLA
jgi:choline dehydrogenase-like flavoprotein